MRIPLAALAASVALSGLVAAPARAAVTQPSGRPCQSSTLTRNGTETYVVSAGPLLLTDEDDPSAIHTGTVTCSVVATSDTNGADHTAVAWFTATGPVGTGVAALPPTVATRPETFDYLNVCTRLDVDGTTLYWHDPVDRNSDGWWTASPAARCDRYYETQDMRPQDPPLGPALSAALVAAGEADEAVGAFDAVACSQPLVADAIDEVWWCGSPSQMSSVSFLRVPGAAVLRTAPPYGWTCTDVHTGLPVTRGSALALPDPGVSCTPSSPVTCSWLELSAALAPTTTGRVLVTNACAGLGVTRTLTAAQARVAEVASGSYGSGATPLRCAATEQTHPAEPAYVVLCAFWT